MSSVDDLIKTKRAVRQFDDKALPDDVMHAILTAGRRAQSSKNTQPWSFIVVRDRERLRQLSQCGAFAGHLAGAAMGVVIAAPDAPPDAEPVEREHRRLWNMFDVGQSAAYMQLAAWEQGVGSCIASIYEPEKAKAILGMPAEMRCDVAISFGYPAPSEIHPSINPDGRRRFDEVVHEERW